MYSFNWQTILAGLCRIYICYELVVHFMVPYLKNHLLYFPTECADSTENRCICPIYDANTSIELDIFFSEDKYIPIDYNISMVDFFITDPQKPLIIRLNDLKHQTISSDRILIHETTDKLPSLYLHVIGYLINETESGNISDIKNSKRNKYDKYKSIFSYQNVPYLYYDRPPDVNKSKKYNFYDYYFNGIENSENTFNETENNFNCNTTNNTYATKMKHRDPSVPYLVSNVSIYYLVDYSCYDPNHTHSSIWSIMYKKQYQSIKNHLAKAQKVEVSKGFIAPQNYTYVPGIFTFNLTSIHEDAHVLNNYEKNILMPINIEVKPISQQQLFFTYDWSEVVDNFSKFKFARRFDTDTHKLLFLKYFHSWHYVSFLTIITASLFVVRVICFGVIAPNMDFFINRDNIAADKIQVSTNIVLFELISQIILLLFLIDRIESTHILVIWMNLVVVIPNLCYLIRRLIDVAVSTNRCMCNVAFYVDIFSLKL